MKIRNKSSEEQTFTNHPPFAPGETRDVSDSDAEFLSRSPHMEIVTGEKTKGSSKMVTKDSSFRGVDRD